VWCLYPPAFAHFGVGRTQCTERHILSAYVTCEQIKDSCKGHIHSFVLQKSKEEKMRRFKLPGFICKPQPTPTEALQKKYILQQILQVYAGHRKKPHRWLYNWWE